MAFGRVCLVVRHAVRYMTGSHVAACRFAVSLLIVEEHIGMKGFQKFPFIQPAQKQGFINADIPGP